MKLFKLLEDVGDKVISFKKGELIEEDQPYTRITDEGELVVCYGMGCFLYVEKGKFKVIEK